MLPFVGGSDCEETELPARSTITLVAEDATVIMAFDIISASLMGKMDTRTFSVNLLQPW